MSSAQPFSNRLLADAPLEVFDLSPHVNHRFKCWRCERPKNKDVSIRLDANQRAGVAHCHKCGMRGQVMHPELISQRQGQSREQWREEMRKRTAERAVQRRRQAMRSDARSSECRKEYEAVGNRYAAPDHPYFTRKKIQPQRPLKLSERGELMIPMMDANKVMQSMQTIAPDGTKRFYAGAPVRGLYHYLGTADATGKTFVICEGYATGVTLQAATNLPVLVAFSAGNLRSVGVMAASKYPLAHFIIAADDDYETGEVGYSAALDAAQAMRAKLVRVDVVRPDLDHAEGSTGTDFNDMAQEMSLAAVAAIFEPVVSRGTELGPPVSGALMRRPRGNPYESYQYKLTKSGQPAFDEANVQKMLWEDCGLWLHVAFDTFTQSVIIDRSVFAGRYEGHSGDEDWQTLTDDDVLQLHCELTRTRYNTKQHVTRSAIRAMARQYPRNAAVPLFTRAAWDGEARLHRLAREGFGNDTPFAAAAIRNLCVAMATRVMRPGSKFDQCVVLVGKQGIFKSTALKTLVGDELHVELSGDLMGRDSLMVTRNSLLVELDELASLENTRSQRMVKAWLSRAVDEYRAPYDSIVQKHPRRFVPVGTTNEDRFLSDPTGERRWWPVTCGAISLDWIRANRDQLMAEAWSLALARAEYHVVPDQQAAVEPHEIIDERGELVEQWLHATWSPSRPRVTLLEVMQGPLGIPTERCDKRTQGPASALLKQAGWIRTNTGREWAWRPSPQWIADHEDRIRAGERFVWEAVDRATRDAFTGGSSY